MTGTLIASNARIIRWIDFTCTLSFSLNSLFVCGRSERWIIISIILAVVLYLGYFMVCVSNVVAKTIATFVNALVFHAFDHNACVFQVRITSFSLTTSPLHVIVIQHANSIILHELAKCHGSVFV